MKYLTEEMKNYKRVENRIILIFPGEELYILHNWANWLTNIILIFKLPYYVQYYNKKPPAFR